MKDEKKVKALEIYQEMRDALNGSDDIAGVFDIVNSLLRENGLLPAEDADEIHLTAPEREEAASGRLICPLCGSPFVRKNGSSKGRKRYFCKNCGSYFGETTGKVVSRTKEGDKWRCFLEGMLRGDTLKSLSEKCGICIATAYSWRMKLFSQVMNSTAGTVLSALIHEGEFSLPDSFKGNRKSLANLGIEGNYDTIVPDYVTYGFRDKPRMRGRADRSKAGSPPPGESSKGESPGGRYNARMVSALQGAISAISHSRFSFSTKNTEAYVTWEAWKLLNGKKSLADKVKMLENLVSTGKKVATNREIRHAEFPKGLLKARGSNNHP